MWYNPKKGKKGLVKGHIHQFLLRGLVFKFREFIMLQPLKQFLEYLVENKTFYSTKRTLRVYTACNKWLK